MFDHPFTSSTFNKTIGPVLILTAIVVQWGLLILYAGYDYEAAIVDSIVSIGLLAVAGYLGWFFILQVRVWQAQIGVALLVQVICLGISFSVLSLLGLNEREAFIASLPLRFLFGLLCWVILLQWYTHLNQETDEPSVIEKTELPVIEEELIDRISVKDGTRIHIIHIDELFCIQASGDYVTLFTPSGQYIKEQTMKYFESHLPQTSFVRIHRSTIVNTNYIIRVELFGKESYQVRLKNGTSVRASNSGYKLLKERLNL